MGERSVTNVPHGRAWLLLCVVIVMHVGEEAATGFLSEFAPLVSNIGSRFGVQVVMPPFGTWIMIVGALVAMLLALTPWVYRGARWLVWGSYVLAALMIGNGLNHLLSPLYLGHFLPGEYTSPLLIAASIWLAVQARTSHER